MKCSECGRDMKIRKGRYGNFWGCTGYPGCKHTESIEKHKKLGGEDESDAKREVKKVIVQELHNFDTLKEASDFYNKLGKKDKEVRINHYTIPEEFYQVEWKEKE